MNNGIYFLNDISGLKSDDKLYTAASEINKLEIADFVLSNETVQGATTGKLLKEGLEYTYIQSTKRFKLYTEDYNLIYIKSGNGFIKWSRGERNFKEGDLIHFFVVKEYELNGICSFIVFKK